MDKDKGNGSEGKPDSMTPVRNLNCKCREINCVCEETVMC